MGWLVELQNKGESGSSGICLGPNRSKRKYVRVIGRGIYFTPPSPSPPLSFWGGMREVSRTKGITQILFEFSPIEKAPSLIDLRRPLSVIAVVCSFTGDPPKLAPTPFLCVGPSIRWVPIPVNSRFNNIQ
jgi:hypothetical protein